MARIKRKYDWPGIRRVVKVYVTGCEACAKRKGPSQRKRAPMKTQISGYPMKRIAADILGELPKTNDGIDGCRYHCQGGRNTFWRPNHYSL